MPISLNYNISSLNQVYYHNAATKESKWTIPEELDAARKQAASLEAAATAAATAAPAPPVAAMQPGPLPSLPHGMPMMGGMIGFVTHLGE